MKLGFLLSAAVVALAPAAVSAQAPAPLAGVKNVIVIINDGGGETVYDALRLYRGAPLTTDGSTFRKVHVSTYPLRPDSPANNQPGTDAQDPSVVYDSAKFWDTDPVAGISTVPGYSTPASPGAGFSPLLAPLYPAAFEGYEWSRFAHPDSGNTASSIADGVKTYNNAINVDGSGDAQITFIDLIDAARLVGKTTGVVSTVQFSDATPAALGGAHNIARANRTAIAAEMFSTGKLDVIGGTGNPDYNDDGQVRTPAYTWVSQPLWTDLKAGTNTSGLNGRNWQLIQDKEPIQALAAKSVKPSTRPLAMIIKGDNSSQFNRTNTATIVDPVTGLARPIRHTEDTVLATPLKTNVPSQAELTIAALNKLDAAGKGFYLMSEAGAVDRAEHANDTARMIEELDASDVTVQAIIDWVNRKDTSATWDNTLLIITADHDHLLYGPQGDTIPFQPLEDRGPGNVPGNKWFGPNHGTGVVPLYAYGKGADAVVALASRTDSYTDQQGRSFGYGAYLDQTDLGNTLKATLGQTRN